MAQTKRRRYRFADRAAAEDAVFLAEEKQFRTEMALRSVMDGKVRWLEETVEQEDERIDVRLGLFRLTAADGGSVIVEYRTHGDNTMPNMKVWSLDDYIKVVSDEYMRLSHSPVRYAALQLAQRANTIRREEYERMREARR